MSRKMIPMLLVFALALFGCGFANTATPAAPPTDSVGAPTLAATTVALPTATTVPSPGDTPASTAPTATAVLFPSDTPAPAAAPVLIPASANYIDDRSTPSQVIVSLYNAISRQEYLRAYNYWINPADTLGDLDTFSNGYQDTASVDLVFGQISGEPGMSQVYYTVPVILKTTAKNGSHANYAACYVVHETNPAVYDGPSVDPMGIVRGLATPVELSAGDAGVLAMACTSFPGGSSLVLVEGSSLNIDKGNFLDNRSGPVETVSSFLNALNLKQYSRAYTYFQNPASYPGAYAPYAAGYADTDGIAVTFGTVQSEGAAGSLYYKLPLALHVTTTSSAKQTFVGCYTLRLAQPSFQATPPFQPMGIIAGKFMQYPNGTDVTLLLAAACN